MKLKEALKYYGSSNNSKEKKYSRVLLVMAQEIGDKAAEKLLEKAEAQGKFISIKYDEDAIDGGEYVIVDTLPD